MGIIAALTVILIVFITVVCLPVSYSCMLYIGSPFHVSGTLCWLGRAFSYTWQYTYGNRPQTEWYLLWKKQQSAPRSTQDAEMTKEQQEAILHELKKETHTVTYDELHTADPAVDAAETHKKHFSWKSLICTEDFALAFFTWLQDILCISRIRTLTLAGTLGLTAPHKTGMLAGALYAVIPASTSDLHFNFTAEEYDCTVHAAGRICLAAAAACSITFLLSRPVRHVLAQWHAARKEENHG